MMLTTFCANSAAFGARHCAQSGKVLIIKIAKISSRFKKTKGPFDLAAGRGNAVTDNTRR